MVSLSGCATDLGELSNNYSSEDAEDIQNIQAGFGGPALYSDRALRGYNARYRLTTFGIRCLRYTVWLDEAVDGKVTGRFKSRDDCPHHADRQRTNRSFSAGSADIGELKELIVEAGMFRETMQIWTRQEDPNSICVDGIGLMFERRDSDGYRVTLANTPCTASESVLAVANKFLEIAQAKRAGVL
ncbi:hypothetical protein [Altererythrobacter sp.]|uniref:hypothetical protein n=1 Tax=Altererythrobacter sp. TaxID=1872480 RepID=UPI003D0B3469